MELLGQTRTGAYTFQSSLKQEQNDVSRNFDKSLKMNGGLLDLTNDGKIQPSATMRAPYSAIGATSGRYGSTNDYKPAFVLSDGEIPKMQNDCKLTTLNSAKMNPEFLKVRNGHAGPIMFTKEDWKISNNSNLCTADRTLAGSELMRADALRACSDVCEKTHKAQRDSTKRLDYRTKDVFHWKNELQKEMDKLLCDIKQLEKMEQCIMRALQDTEEPSRISLLCLEERKNRKDIDLVDDDVDHELRKEIDIIRDIQADLKSQLSTIQNLLRKSSDLLKKVSNNISNKFVALNLDNSSKKLTNTSKGLMNSLQASDPCISDVESWVDEACALIRACQELRANNANLRDQSKQLLTSCFESMSNQWKEIGQAFSVRISEYLSAKTKLESQLKKVLEELVDSQKMIEYIKKNIKDLRKPLQVAVTRISLRAQRPGSEDCYDPAHEKLSKETVQIGLSAEELEAKLREAEFVEQELSRTKRCLEHDLQVKVNSLYIDREKCLGLMRSYCMPAGFSC